MPQSPFGEMFLSMDFKEPRTEQLKDGLFAKNNIEVFMLRLDEIHPVVSGNKLFKLYYFLKKVTESAHQRIITFGGAYSNHLAATAFACGLLNLNCVGIVRGEEPKILSPTLSFCRKNKMQLEFISRSSYKNTDAAFFEKLKNKYGEHILIPEGGFSVKGKEGASLISQYFADKNFSHVCLPVGTATTLAGIVDSNENKTEIIGFSVLKNLDDIDERFKELKVNPMKTYSFCGDYHFGGYAKKTSELISFMNQFYVKNKIPLDFVYTAKMMFGVYDLINKDFFKEGSKILCIHTGGLQGNNSLTKNELIF
ncbi:MAG: pyridoxal-phosphate dependent enzyme [Ginsengibacter sp.]